MARFAGVPVGAQPRFGGVPVEADSAPAVEPSVTVGPFTEVSRGPVASGQSHMSDDYRASIDLEPVERSVPGDLSDMLLRGIMAVPELAGNVVELPANAWDAQLRAVGIEPENLGPVYGGVTGRLRDVAGLLQSPAAGMDEVGMGAGSVGTGDLVGAFTPNRAPTMSDLVAGEVPPQLTIGDRAGTVGRFALEQAVRSGPEMLAAVASLPGYIGARTNQIAETRAGNDDRADVSLTDLLAAAPVATIEGALERFTTGRLLPGAGGAVAPGIASAAGRIAREVGIQAPLGGAEEVAAYLGETLGTERGSTGREVLESFAGGAVGEGAIGGTAQSAKEVAGAIARRGDRRPSNAIPPLGDPEPSIEPNPGTVAPEDDADLEALLVKNLLGADVAEALGIEPEATVADTKARIREIFGDGTPPAPVLDAGRLPPLLDTARLESMLGDTESAPAAPPAATATEVRTSQPAQILTPEQSGQASAPQSAPAGAGADLSDARATGALYRRGSGRSKTSAEALQAPDGTWYTRNRSAGRWSDWQKRDSFDPSPTFGYRRATVPSASIRIPGVGAIPMGEREAPQPRKENPLLDLIVGSGGISRADAARMGVDPAEMNDRVGVRPIFGRNGVPLDSLREVMIEEGYLPPEDPDAPPRLDIDDVWDLASRAIAGDPVFPIGDPRADELRRQEQEAQYDPEADRDDALAQWFDDASPDEPIMAGDEAEALSIAELAERAAATGVDDADLARAPGETDAAYAARLWDEIYLQEANGGPDRQAEEGGIREGVRGREGRETAADREQADDFALGAPESPAEAPRREVAPSQGAGLFGAPTARDFIDARTRERDDERNGRTGEGRTDMLAGDGELFAGPRPAQARVDDAASALAPAPSTPQRQPASEGLESVERDLVVTHNLTAEKLMHAIRMGGLAVPSLAVTKGDASITGFGDITLIGDPRLADPKAGAKTFGADVYSPRYPEVSYKLDATAVRRLNEIIGAKGARWQQYITPDDLVGEDAFREYLTRTLGEDWRFHNAQEEAARVLREAGATEHTFEGYTYSGSRRYKPHTLENVVKKLKRDLRGGENYNYGVGSLRAKFTPQFRSLTAIRKEKGRLVSKDDFERVKAEVDAEFFSLVDALRPYSQRGGSSFGFSDDLIDAFGDAAKMGVPRALEEWQIPGVPAEIQQDVARFLGKLRDLPTEYFEVIQARAVDVSEFRAAVVPSDTKPEVRAALERRGLEVIEYPRADEAARRAAVQQAAERSDLLFNTAEQSRQDGEDTADLFGLREAVNAALGPVAAKVKYLDGIAGLPERLRRGVERKLEQRGGRGRTAALYDPKTGDVYLFTDVMTTPERAVWNVAHEIAGHEGLRTLLGDKLDHALEIALQNPTVKAVADAIARERNIDTKPQRGRMLAAEEALAELAAAVRTGDYDHIASRYKVDVPEGIRAKVARAIENFLRRLKALFDQAVASFTDEDVRALLENAWQAVDGGRSTAGEALESTAPDQTQTPEFRRWFGDSKVVDENGEPLVVYHGTGYSFDEFVGDHAGAGWFAQNPDGAAVYALERDTGEPQTYAAYLSIKNPLVLDFDMNDGIEAAAKVVENLGLSLGGDFGWASRAWEAVNTELFSDMAAEAGYDGLRVNEGGESTWNAFRPNQIKSATANRGTFDPESDSILEAVEYTPEQEAAMAKAGLPVDRRSTLQRARDKVREEWTKLREAARDSDALKQATFDRFHGLRMAEAQLGLSDPETSPYVAARMTAGLPSNMEGLMLYGAPKWDGGILAIKDGTKGLLDALKPVEGHLNEWLGWMVGRRAQVLKKQGRENNLSDADIAALLSLANGREQAFKQAAKDYLAIKDAVLDVAEQAGLIDPAARAAWDHAEYIPFYRAENEGAIGPGTRRGLAGQSSGIRTLKGGEDALADPLANIVRNFSKLLDGSLKNRATLLAVDQFGPKLFQPAPREMQPATIPLDQVKRHLREQGVPEATIAGMPTTALKGVQRMLSIVPPSGEDVVRVMRDGKPEYYQVLDPLVLRSLTAFKQPNKNIAIKPFIWFKRLLTTGVTVTPEFVAANFIRDTGSAWIISDDRFIPAWDSLKGVGNTLRNDAGTREMMMAGSTFLGGNFYDGDPDAAAAALRRALRKKGMSNRDVEGFMGTVARSPLHLWDGWLRLSGAVENANRRAVYDAALKAGRSKTEAAFMARDLMDFAMQGDAAWVQFFSDVLPFFNARLQGLYKLGRRAGTRDGKRAILLRGGVLMMASTALYAWNILAHSEGWDELEEWDKDAYWHIAPGTEYHVRIPKPFELGLVFGTAPERMMEAVRHATTGEGDRPSATWDALVRAITGTLAFNPVPQAALPIAEQWANKRFFTGRPIENMGDEQLLPEARAEWYTSDTMKVLGRLSGLSPKRLEHLWKGYTAGMGGYVLDASDTVVRMLQGAPERPEMRKSEWPVLGRFLRGGSPGRSKYTTLFYEKLREAEQIEQTVKELWVRGDRDEANALAAEHKALLGARVANKRAKGGFQFVNPKRLRKLQTELGDIRDEIEAIASHPQTPDTYKRERIDTLEAKRNRLVREAVRGLEE